MRQAILFLADIDQIRSEPPAPSRPVLLQREDIFSEPRFCLRLDGKEELEALLVEAWKQFKELRLRYPLYILVNDLDLELIARLSRLGALPFMGECSLYSAQDNEALWMEITENLRKREFPEN